MDSAQGVPAAPRRRRFVLPLVALLVVALAGGVVYLVTRHEIGRDPVEFLPAHTDAAVDFDSRVSAPAALRLARTWSPSDVRRLSDRATEMAQKVVDWSGFDLDIKKDVQPWYGGELVVASVAQKGLPPLAPGTAVLIARTKSMRHARASLDKGVRSFAHEAEWVRRTEERDGDTVISWADAKGREHIAYAVKGNCLVVGRYVAPVVECLRAADQPSQQLARLDRFHTTAGKMDEDGGAWAYFDVGAVARAGSVLRPLATGGKWVTVLRDYVRGDYGSGAAHDEEEAGVIAVGMSPEPKGVRLRGMYRGAGGKVAPVTPARVAQFTPRTAAAYLLVRDPGDRWLRLVTPDPFGSGASVTGPSDVATSMARAVMQKLLPPPTTWFGFTQVPTQLLVVVLPRRGESRPALAVVAPADEVATPPRGLLAVMSKQATAAVVSDLEIIGTDPRAVKECEAAMKSPRARLSPAPDATARFEAWVKPLALSDKFDQVKEIRLQGREVAGGGEGELSIIVPPRYLLGD